MLNFNHLYNFFIIAKEGSIIKACKQLHVTQSTLSTQLKELEDSLGEKLFDRKVRKLILNETGKIVFSYAKKIFSLSDELIQSVSQHKMKKVTIIGIGSVPSLPKPYVHEFTLPLWKNKNIIVRTKDSKLTSLLRDLEVGAIDVILSDMKAMTIGKKIVNRRLLSRKIIVAAHKRFLSAKKNFPQSLNGLPFINYTEESNVRGEIDHYLKINKIKPDIIGEVDDINLLKITAEKGLCFVIVPENSVNEAISDGKLIKLGNVNTIETGTWAITRTDDQTPEVVKKAIQRFYKLY